MNTHKNIIEPMLEEADRLYKRGLDMARAIDCEENRKEVEENEIHPMEWAYIVELNPFKWQLQHHAAFEDALKKKKNAKKLTFKAQAMYRLPHPKTRAFFNKLIEPEVYLRWLRDERPDLIDQLDTFVALAIKKLEK